MGTVLDVPDRETQAIQDLCRQIADGFQATANCPRCATVLEAKASLHAVQVTCLAGCFRFSFHRDPLTGTFVSGVLDLTGTERLAGHNNATPEELSAKEAMAPPLRS